MILELGANDALRGVDPKLARSSLEAMLERLKARHIPVLLAGMLAPRNLGPDYGAAFDAIYPDLAGKFGAILYPFFLDGVAADPKLNQRDGLHPTAAGVDVIVAKILPAVEQLAAAAKAASRREACPYGLRGNGFVPTGCVAPANPALAPADDIAKPPVRWFLESWLRSPCPACLPLSKSPPMSASRSHCCAAACRVRAGSTPRTIT